jgi:hypothetical protein
MREFSNCFCALGLEYVMFLLKFLKGLHRHLVDEVVSSLCWMVNFLLYYYWRLIYRLRLNLCVYYRICVSKICYIVVDLNLAYVG